MARFVMLLFLFSQVAVGATPKPIRVGLLIPATRVDGVTVNPWGVQQQRGFEMALNAAKHVSFKVSDASESALLAKEKASEFVKGDFDLIAGLSFSDQALAVKQETEPARVPFLTVFATSEALFDKTKSVFSMAVPNNVQVSKIVNYLSAFPALKKAGIGLIVTRNCEYCVDMERGIKDALRPLGIEVTQYPDIHCCPARGATGVG